MKKLVIILLFLGNVLHLSAQDSGTYQIKFLEVNKQNSDYAVAMLDNNKLVFTSAGKTGNIEKRNYNPRKMLFVGEIDMKGEVVNIQPISGKEDKRYNTTGVAYTNDLKKVYFSRNKYVKKRSKQNQPKYKRLELFRADVDEGGNWTNIEKLPFNDDRYSTGYPALSKDNTKLYFVSDRLPSKGKTDIFVVDILPDGSFGIPRNLGNKINTPGEETTPYITDKNILYFSSNGHKGKGNFDIFAAEVSENNISDVYHLEAPINSVNDDIAFIMDNTNTHGYFTSNRLQGQNNYDLYAFEFKKQVDEDCFIVVEGFVKDAESHELLEGAKVAVRDLFGTTIKSISTGDDGSYNFTVPCDNEYQLVATSDNYEDKVQRIEILDHNKHRSLHTNLNLKRIKDIIAEVNNSEEIVKINPIFFDFDKYNIRSDSRPELDKIIRLMKNNPKIVVEAGAHTDSRGTHAYNKILSQRRADATRKYIIRGGIDPDRIIAKGYGEEKLLNHCTDGVKCSEAQHQQNRRTEFIIVNTETHELRKQTVSHINSEAIEREKQASEKQQIAKPDKPAKKSFVAQTPSAPDPENAIVQTSEKQQTVENRAASKQIKETNIVQEESDKPQVEVKQKMIRSIETTPEKAGQVDARITEAHTKSAYQKTNNKAENYIMEQKVKVIEKIEKLENKFEQASVQDEAIKNTLLEERQKIAEFKKEVLENENPGWSNIIEYNNQIIAFNKTYMRLMVKKGKRGQTTSTGKTKKKDAKELSDYSSREAGIIMKPVNEDPREIKVKEVKVIAMKKAGKKYAVTKNAKKAELIKVSFKVLHNEKAEAGKKEAHIVLETPNGKVTDAKGVFKIKDSEELLKYTDHTVIDYNNNDIVVEMFIERKGHEYPKGVYPLKLFLDGKEVAKTNLNLASSF